MKILCIDDHPAVLDTLVKELNTIVPTASVWPFRDTVTALEFVEENGCDVLFCEIDLYNSDGIVFAEKVQNLNPRVNIIFTTVCEERERAKDVIRLRPSGYITKPYSRDQLIRELSNLRYPDEKIQISVNLTEPVLKQERQLSEVPVETNTPEEKVTEEVKSQSVNTKDLKKLSRADLLEMLIMQTKENEKLSAQLKDAENELASKKLKIDKAGSIAQASLSMYGVFEAAQKAADHYLESIRNKELEIERTEKEANERAELMIAEATERAERIIAEAEALCDNLMRETDEKCEEMKLMAKIDSERSWEEVRTKIGNYLNEHEALRSLVGKYM